MAFFVALAKRLSRRVSMVALATSMALCSGATAQSPTLKGRVRNASGQPIASAITTLENTGTAEVMTTKTDSQGTYQFSGLKNGVYILHVDASGYSRKNVERFFLKAAESRELDVDMAVLESKAATEPDFYDEPQFTVAGVTDTTNLGTHGADTVVRNTESLVRETASMGKSASETARSSADTSKLNSLRDAVERDPRNFKSNYELGSFLLKDGNAREATRYLEQASNLNPADSQASSDLAAACFAIGDYTHARAALQASLRLRESADSHRLLGDVDEKLSDPISAVHEYQRAAELLPSESNLFNWGAELLMHRAFEPAGEVFTKGNRLFPNSSRMLVGLGVSLYARGSYEQAVQRLCQASDLDLQATTPYLFLGKIQTIDSAQSREVIERFARFAEMHPENAQAAFYYGSSLWKARHGPEDVQNLPKIEILLKHAVELDPKLGSAYLQLGILYEEQGNLPDTLAAYQQAVEVSPSLEQAHYRLAQLYRKRGDEQKAKAEIALYEKTSKEAAAQAEREQHEMQGFVYTMRDQTYGTPAGKKDAPVQ